MSSYLLLSHQPAVALSLLHIAITIILTFAFRPSLPHSLFLCSAKLAHAGDTERDYTTEAQVILAVAQASEKWPLATGAFIRVLRLQVSLSLILSRSLSLILSRNLSLRLMFKDVLSCTGGVLFHAEWCIRQL